MRTANIKKPNYHDNLASRRRRVFIFKIALVVGAFVAGVGGLVYFLFFSNVLTVKEISINGLTSLDKQNILSEINSTLESKTFKYLKTQKNILFFNPSRLRGEIMAQSPVVKDLDIKKKYPHEIVLGFTERKPVGIWCFQNDCYYFDKDRVTWGNAAKSSGFIFLSIQDNRTPANPGAIDKDFFDAIMTVLSGITTFNVVIPDLTVKNIVIPAGSLSDFQVNVAQGYPLMFSLDSDIKNQLDILKIFLNDKKKDPSFGPQYIDLRIDGRVYYK